MRKAMLLALLAAPTAGASDAALLRDLTHTLLVLGVPCGQVVAATRQADHDHIASCSDGNRYRVFVNAQGRLVADKQ
jgi:hypothetical protein